MMQVIKRDPFTTFLLVASIGLALLVLLAAGAGSAAHRGLRRRPASDLAWERNVDG